MHIHFLPFFILFVCDKMCRHFTTLSAHGTIWSPLTVSLGSEMFLLQISEIISRFERKGYKLVGIKVLIPSKEFAQKHYHDLKDKPFFNGLCEFLSSGPVVAMVG